MSDEPWLIYSPCALTSRPEKRCPNIKIEQSHTTPKPMLWFHTAGSTTDLIRSVSLSGISGINRWSSSLLEFICTDPHWAALLLLWANLCIHWPSRKLLQIFTGQSIPALHSTAIVYKSLSKGIRWKGSYSSPQRCQSPVPPPSWSWGRCLAGAACWLSGAPSASWSSLPSADPTGLQGKKEIKESVIKTKHLFLVKERTAQALPSGLHHSCSGQSHWTKQIPTATLWPADQTSPLFYCSKGQPENGGLIFTACKWRVDGLTAQAGRNGVLGVTFWKETKWSLQDQCRESPNPMRTFSTGSVKVIMDKYTSHHELLEQQIWQNICTHVG